MPNLFNVHFVPVTCPLVQLSTDKTSQQLARTKVCQLQVFFFENKVECDSSRKFCLVFVNLF